MAEIRHRVGINAPAEDVYEALTTTEGVARWWWQDARGDSRGKRPNRVLLRRQPDGRDGDRRAGTRSR